MPSQSVRAVLSAIVFSSLAAAQAVQPGTELQGASDNPYRLAPFVADFPVPLEYPPHSGLEYDRTRRQMLERLVGNLGMARREAWQLATEFFWRAPEDAVDPLIAAMDKAMGNPALVDIVKNSVEAMGRMGNQAFDAALRRALQHKHPAVVQAAFAALGASGKPETLRELAAAFPQMDTRSRSQWLRGVRQRLGDDAVPLFRQIMDGPYIAAVRDQVLKEALLMTPEQAATVLRGRWLDAVGEFQAVIAGVLHAVGDTSGTTWLREHLGSSDLAMLKLAIRHCATFGQLGELREPLLRATTHLNPDVRLAALMVLTGIQGDDVVAVLEVLASPDQAWEVRAIAMRELVKRGRAGIVDVLLEEAKTATSTRLHQVLAELTASGDPRAVPVLRERFDRAPVGEGRPFLQSLAQNASDAAAHCLLELYRGPEIVVGRAAVGELTTRNYIPTLLLNLRGSEGVVLEEFLALPKEATSLRARLVPVLGGIAADREDDQLAQRLIEPLRTLLFDTTELPQLRLLALNQLTMRWLTLEDALRLKNQRSKETPPVRALWNDFLQDMF
ncbi:MAG: HEAT repeat domain-containing protein [Planctomycetes bacterium]|nr:HEAT repeat domain-containing protein [Planctomycetota bacterium]